MRRQRLQRYDRHGTFDNESPGAERVAARVCAIFIAALASRKSRYPTFPERQERRLVGALLPERMRGLRLVKGDVDGADRGDERHGLGAEEERQGRCQCCDSPLDGRAVRGADLHLLYVGSVCRHNPGSCALPHRGSTIEQSLPALRHAPMKALT